MIIAYGMVWFWLYYEKILLPALLTDRFKSELSIYMHLPIVLGTTFWNAFISVFIQCVHWIHDSVKNVL